jgi:GNAT superfamily N-acetyltransferase
MADLTIRRAVSDPDLEAWNRVRRIVLPDEPIATIDQLRAANPDRMPLLAEVDGEVVGHGMASDSNLADGFAMTRILPDQRRRGFGSAVLRVILDHHVAAGRRSVASHAQDDGALAFATHHGFIEVDRQVEQVRTLTAVEPDPPTYPGVAFTSVAADPGLLRRAYPLARQGYADLALATGPAHVPLDEWLRDEASLPGGSMVAIADGEVVGYAGLIAWNDDDTRAENGLTVVDREWRGRGLATALKRRQLAWAAANGLVELVTWTQDANDAMRHVNTRLGYVTRSVSHTVRRDLP